MNNFLFRFILLFAAVFGAIFMLVWFYLSVTQPAEAGEIRAPDIGAVEFASSEVRIKASNGQIHSFQVEIATTPRQHARGLMYRDHLADGHGMLFDFQPPRVIAMWMKNTHISLDMVFADENGRVVMVAPDTVPYSEKLIISPGIVRYVLELPAGTAARLNIKADDLLLP